MLKGSLGTYAASKRSEEIMAETLRMELAPFHVKVVSVVAGAVRTMIQTHFDDLKLPDGSIYAPIESTIIDRARGIDGAKRSDPMDYAKRVTADLFRGSTGRIWHGWSAGMVKFSTSFLPSSLLVSCVPTIVLLPTMDIDSLLGYGCSKGDWARYSGKEL